MRLQAGFTGHCFCVSRLVLHQICQHIGQHCVNILFWKLCLHSQFQISVFAAVVMQTPPPANEPAPAPPAPPAPPEPPCTNPNPTLCPVANATYYSYYHKTRYQDGCTFAAGNPGLTLAPAPTSGEVKPIFAPGTVFCSHHRCTSASHMHACKWQHGLRAILCSLCSQWRLSSCCCEATLQQSCPCVRGFWLMVLQGSPSANTGHHL